jgi:hypothetical protein
VSLADDAFLIDTMHVTTPRETTWYAIDVEPGQSLTIDSDPLGTTQRNEPWLQIYRDSELVDDASRSRHARAFNVGPADEASTYYIRVTDVHRYSLTVAKNVHLGIGRAVPHQGLRLHDSLPSVSRSGLDASIVPTSSYAAFLQAGEQLELSALTELQTGTTRLSIVDADLNVLAETEFHADSAELRYQADNSQYVAIVLEQLTGTSRVLLTTQVQPSVLRANQLAGDLDLSGAIDGNDIDLLYRAATDRFVAENLDLNQDQRIDASDLEHLIAQAGTVVGDLNLDGRFDDDDLAIVQRRYDQPWHEVTWLDGDLDLNGRVDTDDLIRMFQGGGFSAG